MIFVKLSEKMGLIKTLFRGGSRIVLQMRGISPGVVQYDFHVRDLRILPQTHKNSHEIFIFLGIF